ncbi:MAG TPA: GAF domain-containing sensor histidine kinase, partial [Pseudonocardiaceae bacterium]|nr:GAF domain-containing sensor histidine kinase [Pseudonocardiaceae bacterium]
GASAEDALRLVAQRALELSAADGVLILLADADNPDGLTVRSGADERCEHLIGSTIAATAAPIGEVFRSGTSSLIPDLAAVLGSDLSARTDMLGPALAVPLRSATGLSGVLMAVRDKDAASFDPQQVPVLASFADQAALALEAAHSQRAQQLLDTLADRERIGRDLHDHVIQRLYACGMSLQGTLRLVSGQDAQVRIEKVIEQLDETIRDIRTSIFELHTAGGDKLGSLRRRLLDAAAEVSGGTGLSPSVRMSGAVDTLVPPAIAEHAVAVVREAVSNAVRHADATTITVTAEAGDDLVIEVVDNGIGIPEGIARSGLANLEQRARACSGTVTVGTQPQGGTRLTWRVPLP